MLIHSFHFCRKINTFPILQGQVEKNEIYKKLRMIDEKLKKIETEGRILEQVIRSG